MESVITQLVMEHALRIRLKSDALEDKKDKSSKSTSQSGKTSGANSGTSTPRIPDGGDGSEAQSEFGDAETDVATITETSTLVEEEPAPEGGHVKKQSADLVGRINNLITSDLSKVGEAHDVLTIRMYSFLIGDPYLPLMKF